MAADAVLAVAARFRDLHPDCEVHIQEVHITDPFGTGRPIPQGRTATYWLEVLSLVGAGQGVSPAAAATERHFSRPDVVWVPFRDAPPIEYGLVRPACGGQNARVRAFVDLCRTVVRPSWPKAVGHHEESSPTVSP